MFETVTEAKKDEGFQGFTSRHFGPVVDADLARDGVRDIALVLIGLSCLIEGEEERDADRQEA